MFSKLKAFVDCEKFRGIVLSIVQKTITRNSEFSLPSMIPRVTEKLRIIVLCIGPKPITRSLDSPHREFRNFRVFREFGVSAKCAMADFLISEIGVLMSSNFLKPPENQTTFQRPQKSQLSFSDTRNFQTEKKFSTETCKGV